MFIFRVIIFFNSYVRQLCRGAYIASRGNCRTPVGGQGRATLRKLQMLLVENFLCWRLTESQSALRKFTMTLYMLLTFRRRHSRVSITRYT